MKGLIMMWAISACVYGYVPVKGGSSRYTNEQDRYNYNPYQQTHTARPNEVEEIGVCYIEVPTANLGNNDNNIRGNGSRPDLSRIRTCCRGYTTNRYDPSICDPVCSKGCVNAYCVAPERCQCYPDYEQDSDGSCSQSSQKCPHSCQNGHCARDECICDFGYKWDAGSKRCKPECKDDCAGLGTCTAPNYCSCRSGYQSTAEGSCESKTQENSKPLCHSPCPHNSVCIGPNVCSSPTTSVESQEYHHRPSNVKPQYSENQVDSSYTQQQQNQNHVHHDNQNYPQNQYHQYQYPDNRQNLYNPYGEQSQDFYNQRSNDQSQQGAYRRPQESYDTRNQGDRYHDTTQHQSPDDYNQRSYDSQRGQYVDRNTQNTSSAGQFDTGYERNRDDSTQHHDQRTYDSSQYSYDLQRHHHPGHNTQSTSTPNQYNTEYGRNQNFNQEGNNSSQNTYGSSQQRPYDSSRREDVSANEGNYHLYQGSYGTEQESHGTNQRPYFYYTSNSTNNHRETTEMHNQMHSQRSDSHYPDQSIDQQRNVPECSMYCINGHCVEGNRCSCNPGYIPDKSNPNVCQPECPEGCVNGVCSAPRLCLCNAGYYKDKSVKGQVCVKRIR